MDRLNLRCLDIHEVEDQSLGFRVGPLLCIFLGKPANCGACLQTHCCDLLREASSSSSWHSFIPPHNALVVVLSLVESWSHCDGVNLICHLSAFWGRRSRSSLSFHDRIVPRKQPQKLTLLRRVCVSLVDLESLENRRGFVFPCPSRKQMCLNTLPPWKSLSAVEISLVPILSSNNSTVLVFPN